MFTLHPQLAKDTVFIAALRLCDALLMNNALFPWMILVPRCENASEIIDLSEGDRITLMEEIAVSSRAMKAVFKPKKLNVAALGNQVPQLHIHVIARYENDAAWPNPVWGKGSQRYHPEESAERCKLLQATLSLQE